MATYYYPTIDNLSNSVNTEQVFPSYYNLYGHNLLSQIYNNLDNTLTNYSDQYNLKMRFEKNQEIIEKLDKLKKLEQEINLEIQNAELKKYLQNASRGIIDSKRIPDENLPEILEKHSNLLNLTTKYNSKVIDLANILKTVNNVLYDKVTPEKYALNMSIKYPAYYN